MATTDLILQVWHLMGIMTQDITAHLQLLNASLRLKLAITGQI